MRVASPLVVVESQQEVCSKIYIGVIHWKNTFGLLPFPPASPDDDDDDPATATA